MTCFVNIHSHSECTLRNILNVQSFHIDELNQDPYHFFSVGIHPWFISNSNEQQTKLTNYLSHPKLIAIGECGLDKLKGFEFDQQISEFKFQVSLSEIHNKPLIIHCVKAYNELILLKKLFTPKQAWVIHGFKGKTPLAKQLIDAGFYLSLGYAWTKNPLNFKTLLNTIPNECIFFETDEYPAEKVMDIYHLASAHKPDIKEIIYSNFMNVFRPQI